MKIPTVESCCCFGLETAGKIIGWLGIISCSIASIALLIGIVFLVVLSCDELEDIDEFKKVTEEYSLPECSTIKFAMIIGCAVMLVICLISTYIDILLIQGIKTRNSGKIIPVVVIQAISVVSSVIQELLSFTFTGVLRAVIVGGFMFYIFIVLYSLYVRIRNEQRHRANVKFSHLNP